MRLFNTARPAYNTIKAFNQPLCNQTYGEGDLDLGSPNRDCPKAGPGKYKHWQGKQVRY